MRKKIILISGASCSFGVLLCRRLADEGYIIYAGYNKHPFPKNISKSIHPVKFDITSDSSCSRAIEKIVRKHSRIDILINLAGISQSGIFENFTVQNFQQLLDINVIGAFRLMKTALPYIPLSGRVINTGSVCGVVSFPNFSLYSASKAALRFMSLASSVEWRRQKRFVTLISLGGIDHYSKKIADTSARVRFSLLGRLLPLLKLEQVVDKFIEVLKAHNPPPEVLVGRDTHILNFLQRFLPGPIWHTLRQFMWQRQQ